MTPRLEQSDVKNAKMLLAGHKYETPPPNSPANARGEKLMPQWAKRDEAGTRAARKAKEFLDRRSWKGWRKDRTPFIRLHGRDKEAQYQRIHFLWRGYCAVCERPIPGKHFCELDHVVSLGRGGDDADSNLQFLCRPCHRAKHNREVQLGTIPALETWQHPEGVEP